VAIPRRPRVRLGAVWAVWAVAACGGSSGKDAGSSLDGGPDAGADAGFLSDGGLASYCDSAGGGGCLQPYACLSIGGSTGGFCTASCALDAGGCPGTGTCDTVGTATVCIQPCTGTSSCPAGDVCEPITGSTSLCVPDCRTHADMCGTGTVGCSASLGFCTAVGGQMFGEPCQGPDAGACGATLVCAEVSVSAPQGFCTQVCTPDGGLPCPASPSGASCDIDAQTAGTFYCGWPCTGPTDPTCPPGLACQVTGTGSYLCQ
jgi:hypothetical protein